MNNKGNATILAVAICLGIIIIMSIIMEYMQMLIISEGIKDGIESAVVSSVVSNYDETYSQLREGYSGGYVHTGEEFTEAIDNGNVYARLDELLGLTVEGNRHTKYTSDGKKEYTITNLSTDFENADFAQSGNLKNLTATVYADVEIPVRFGGRELSPLSFTLKVKAAYMPKF